MLLHNSSTSSESTISSISDLFLPNFHHNPHFFILMYTLGGLNVDYKKNVINGAVRLQWLVMIRQDKTRLR